MSQQASWDYIAKCICLGDSGTGKSSLTIRLCEGRFSPRTDTTIGVEFGSRVVPVGPPASDRLNINNPAADDDHADAVLPSARSSPSGTPIQQSSAKSPTGSRRSRIPDSQEVQAAVKNGSSKVSPSPHKKQSLPAQQKHMKLSLWDTAGQETYKAITRSYFRGASGALLVFDITRRETFDSVTSWLRDLRAVAEEGIIVVLVGNKADLAPSSTVSAADEENRRQITRGQAEAWCAENDVLKYVETSAKSGEGVERAFLEVAERIFQNIQAGRYDLNDRRSGVKSASTASGGGASLASNTLNLAVEDVNVSAQRTGSCC